MPHRQACKMLPVPDQVSNPAAAGGTELANYQLFLTDLAVLLDLPRPDPSSGDPRTDAYVFERPVTFVHGDGTQSAGRIDLHWRHETSRPRRTDSRHVDCVGSRASDRRRALRWQLRCVTCLTMDAARWRRGMPASLRGPLGLLRRHAPGRVGHRRVRPRCGTRPRAPVDR